MTEAEYTTYVKTPIRNCLTTVGKDQILYIVLAYVRPYIVDLTNYGARAIDSYLIDLWDQAAGASLPGFPSSAHRYFAEPQNQGNVYLPYQTFATFRTTPKAPAMYSVWRLDGLTAAMAKGMVTQAIQAETNGLTGQACFDLIYDLPSNPGQFADAGLIAGDWSLERAARFVTGAGYPVLKDVAVAEIGAGACPNAALYSGWYSYNNYNDAFTWNPGAIGFHLDSASAIDPRGGPNWVANALQRGITVTAGSVTEPYLEGLPNPGPLFRNLLEGAPVGDAFLRNTRWLKWMVLFVGDPLYTPFTGGRSFLPGYSGLYRWRWLRAPWWAGLR